MTNNKFKLIFYCLLIFLTAAVPVLPNRLSVFHFAQLEYDGGNWNPRPHAARHLLAETQNRTSIVTAPDAEPVSWQDAALHDLPFLYWSGEGSFNAFSESERATMKRYLKAGGFIFVDAVDEAFELAAKQALKQASFDFVFKPIPDDHVLYKSFYIIQSHGGRVLRKPALEGIFLDGRLAVVLSPNDHGAAWLRDDFGRYPYEVIPGGETQREMALRLGVNVLMYVLCLDYKDDQVHIPFILKRRR